MAQARVGIVGAGLAGLNAARYLKNKGLESVIFEASDRVGGRVTSDYIDGYICDRGFQVINPAYAELKETGILPDLEIRALPKGLEINTGAGISRIGDARSSLSYLPALLSPKSGALGEKLAFLRYLIGKSEDVDFATAMEGCGSLYLKTLKPFLDGVVLGDVDEISNRVVRELIHWFIKGEPGLVRGGAKVLSEALASSLEVRLNNHVEQVGKHHLILNGEREEFDAIIVAASPRFSARLLGIEPVPMNSCITWYHSAPMGVIEERHLRVALESPILNSVVLSNTAPEYAPTNRSLIATTSSKELSELELVAEMERIWGRSLEDLELIKRYSIVDALPRKIAGSALVDSNRLESGVYVAGDWRAIPAQQGALLSGRLAAMAVIADLSAR